jgi:hypothetical protein
MGCLFTSFEELDALTVDVKMTLAGFKVSSFENYFKECETKKAKLNEKSTFLRRLDTMNEINTFDIRDDRHICVMRDQDGIIYIGYTNNIKDLLNYRIFNEPIEVANENDSIEEKLRKNSKREITLISVSILKCDETLFKNIRDLYIVNTFSGSNFVEITKDDYPMEQKKVVILV